MSSDTWKADHPEQGDIPDVLGAVRRRWWMVAACFALSVITAVIVAHAMPPVYVAVATIIADKNPPVILVTGTSQTPSIFEQQPVSQAPSAETVVELAKSSVVREMAKGQLASFRDRAAVDTVLKGLRIQQVGDTDIVRISTESTSSALAAAAANALARSMVDQDLAARRRLATGTRQFIEQQLERSRRTLEDSEAALVAFKDRNHDVSLSDETVLNLHKLADLEDQLLNVKLQHAQVDAGLPDRGGAAARPSTTQDSGDPVVTTLRNRLAALQVDLSGLRQQYTPAYPAVMGTQAEIDAARSRIGEEVARNQAALDTRERGISDAIAAIEQRLLSVPAQEAQLAALTRNNQDAVRDYTLFSEKLQEARIAEGSIGSALRLVDTAQVPTAPVRPRRNLDAALGAILGIALGAAGAVLADQADDHVRMPRDIERALQAPVLGTIPLLGTPGARLPRGRHVASFPVRFARLSREAEAFRFVRAHALRAADAIAARCVLVTSALSGEGKSTITANLAVSIAQSGRKVCVVDGCLRNPSLSRFFPEADSPGLSQVLAGRGTVDEVIRPAKEVRLSCVVGGPTVTASANLLDSAQVAATVAAFGRKADIVLVDCAAVLDVADVEVLAPHVDGIIVVVQAGRTTVRALDRLRHQLEGVGARIIGAVLNAA